MYDNFYFLRHYISQKECSKEDLLGGQVGNISSWMLQPGSIVCLTVTKLLLLL